MTTRERLQIFFASVCVVLAFGAINWLFALIGAAMGVK